MAKLTNERSYRAFLLTELLRSTGEKEFPMQLASIFFWIAAHDGCKQEEVSKAVNIAPSTVSRNVTWLGPRHRLEHRHGLRLVRREQDPDNHRAWRLFLTPKGKQFVAMLNNHLNMPLSTAIKAAATIKEQIAYDSPDDQDDGSGLRPDLET
jgi:DNA-binding MarR family transcriptional regulator